MNDPYQAGDVNDVASQYMETLIRDHLRTVLENYQALEPPPAQHIHDVTRPYVIQLATIGLQRNNDIMLAYLVRAAVNVVRDASGEELETTDEFPRLTANTMMGVGTAEVTALLQTILEDLVWRDGSRRPLDIPHQTNLLESPSLLGTMQWR
jgi:hypothetical protein